MKNLTDEVGRRFLGQGPESKARQNTLKIVVMQHIQLAKRDWRPDPTPPCRAGVRRAMHPAKQSPLAEYPSGSSTALASRATLVRRSTSLPNTSNNSALTAGTAVSGMIGAA
jgi:hypothetical protein